MTGRRDLAGVAVLGEVLNERRHQEAKHGDQSDLPDGTGPALVLTEMPVHTRAARADRLAAWAKARCKAASRNEGGDGSITWEQILTEEWGEAITEDDPAKLRAELVQVAAVAAAWVEAIDRRQTVPAAGYCQDLGCPRFTVPHEHERGRTS